MKYPLVRQGMAAAIALATLSLTALSVQAQQRFGFTTPIVSGAGTLNSNEDHYIEIQVNGSEPLDRIKIVCVTFHRLSGVAVTDTETDMPVPHSVDYGFETFTVTFDEPIPPGKTVRLLMEDSSIRGRISGINVPYRVFAVSQNLGEIPIGTAIVQVPDRSR